MSLHAQPNTAQKGANIMLIDDEKMDQMMYTRVLKRFGKAGWVGSFSTGMDALDHLRDPSSTPPDIIFLDINMPRMNGFDFLDAAVQEFGSDFAKIVIFMLTTSLDPTDRARADNYEMVKRFINKPLTQELLEDLSNYFDIA